MSGVSDAGLIDLDDLPDAVRISQSLTELGMIVSIKLIKINLVLPVS